MQTCEQVLHRGDKIGRFYRLDRVLAQFLDPRALNGADELDPIEKNPVPSFRLPNRAGDAAESND